MSEMELNRWAHSFLGQGCYHDLYYKSSEVGDVISCRNNCDAVSLVSAMNARPDYCSSLDLAAKVESKAIEMVGEDVYINHLSYALSALKTPSERREVSETGFMRLMVTAPAITRVQAARDAVDSIK